MRARNLSWAAAALLLPGLCGAANIVVDTGHNRTAGGVVAFDGTPEFALNRTMAVAVIAMLRSRGHEVFDVHQRGYDRTLMDRTSRSSGTDLFLSIHHDSVQQQYLDAGRHREFSGFSSFISARTRDVEGSLRCARLIGEGMAAAGERPSHYHAEQILGESRPLLDAQRGVHRYDGLAVLRTAGGPAVLLEVGVAINPDDLPRLKNPEWVRKTATHLASAIEGCVPRAAAKR